VVTISMLPVKDGQSVQIGTILPPVSGAPLIDTGAGTAPVSRTGGGNAPGGNGAGGS